MIHPSRSSGRLCRWQCVPSSLIGTISLGGVQGRLAAQGILAVYHERGLSRECSEIEIGSSGSRLERLGGVCGSQGSQRPYRFRGGVEVGCRRRLRTDMHRRSHPDPSGPNPDYRSAGSRPGTRSQRDTCRTFSLLGHASALTEPGRGPTDLSAPLLGRVLAKAYAVPISWSSTNSWCCLILWRTASRSFGPALDGIMQAARRSRQPA